MPGEEERIQKIVEEERLRAITESLQKNNNRVFTPEESKKYMSIMEDINTCKRRQKELDRLHQEKRAAYQEQLKKENLIPLLAPMYFILTAFIVVDILCIIVFRHIFDQTPILQYLWAICAVLIAALVVFQVSFLRKGRIKREPMKAEILEIQNQIAANEKRLRDLEAERSAI
ncbi:MAG: OPT/YSL family transporter [Clostridia bacterium]|nr:OPT/YSL family transporter [Clostridia bacterium]